jgi:hypothetical protein
VEDGGQITGRIEMINETTILRAIDGRVEPRTESRPEPRAEARVEAASFGA